jgi:N-acetylglutamate synthase-like GNAT family acetyltransferase
LLRRGGIKESAMTTVTIAPARPSDYDVVAALLEREHLPLDDLRQHFENAFVARAGDRIVGCSALEMYEGGALLRSLVVDAEYRGAGVGGGLTDAAIQLARRRLAPAVYLLTTTAERFFPKFRFEVVDRADVPASVLASAEFAHACPSTAIVMRRFLTST